MGFEAEEAEKQGSSIPRLPLFSAVPPLMQSPERPGMVTPPLHSNSASVPFQWEQEPGKPRPCTALVPFSNPKCLELPPRLLLLPSPPTSTTILEPEEEDPNYVDNNNSNRFLRPPSFRISNDCYGGSSSSAETGLLGAMVLSKGGEGKRGKWWWFGSNLRKKAFKIKVKREVNIGGSHVFPSSAERETGHSGTHKNKVSMSKMKRSGSFSILSSRGGKSRIWTTIWEGLKQVVPWKSKKLKKYGSDLEL